MFKQKIFNFIDKGSHGSRVNLIFDYFIMILILLNVLAIVIESVPSLRESYGLFFRFFEIFSVAIFTIEYILRLYVSDLTHPAKNKLQSILRFIFSPFGLVDLFAIAPFYLPFFIKIDLRFLRVLRLLRFFRVFKINRYNNSLNLIWMVIKEKRTELAITVFITFLILLVASILMYHIEGPAQPDKFSSVVSSFWWAIATLTTVGYGDIYPITGFGKVVSGFIAVLGIGLVALPTGLVSAGFVEKIGKKNQERKRCPHCGKEMD